MQTNYTFTLLGTWNAFFREMIGDLGDLDDLELEVNSWVLYVFFLMATLILYITMLNLLIAIISDSFGEVKKAEKRTKIWEKWNIITEIDIMLDKIEPKKKYLMYIYNERHEKEFTENEEEHQKWTHLHDVIEKNQKINEENQKKNDEYFRLISNEIKIIEENQKKSVDYLKNMFTEMKDIINKKQ